MTKKKMKRCYNSCCKQTMNLIDITIIIIVVVMVVVVPVPLYQLYGIDFMFGKPTCHGRLAFALKSRHVKMPCSGNSPAWVVVGVVVQPVVVMVGVKRL